MKVIYIMADTFRRDHIGAYGNDWIHTPNLDKLASESAVFDNAYIGSFPTVPNRRDTLLGRGDIGLPFNRWKTIERQEVTLPERLGEKGIPSMWIGDTQNNVTRGINIYKGYTAWYLNRGQEADPYRSGPPVPDARWRSPLCSMSPVIAGCFSEPSASVACRLHAHVVHPIWRSINKRQSGAQHLFWIGVILCS